MTFLAQTDLPSVPAEILKWTIIVLVAAGLVGMLVAAFVRSLGKPDKVKLDDDPAINVRNKPPRFNFDLAESRHAEHTRRLDGHDAEIEQLWMTMRSEDAAIRRENGAKFDAILLSLGEIKGELKNRK